MSLSKIMNVDIPFFLYRRLARWITCEFGLPNNQKIRLSNKYEISSFKDVFCHPFYWQILQHFHDSPKLIVDCGAHCGHFTALAEICLHSKFSNVNTEYVLVEPNPYLLAVIKQSLLNMNIAHRVQVKHGLLGKKNGSANLWIDSKNYLATGLHQSKGANSFAVNFIDLQDVIGDRVVDLMKIDIEGGEFEFVRFNLELFKQVNLIVMELHNASEELHKEIFDSLRSVGLNLIGEPMYANGQQLLILKRNSERH